MEQEYYIIAEYSFDIVYGSTVEILCEDGHFYQPHSIMENSKKTPIFFSSEESAKQAKKLYGHWPKYRIQKITDPSWLN